MSLHANITKPQKLARDNTLLVRDLSGKEKESFITFPTGFKINCHIPFNPDLCSAEKGSDQQERVTFSQQLQQQL